MTGTQPPANAPPRTRPPPTQRTAPSPPVPTPTPMAQYQPHPTNMEEAWRARKTTPKNKSMPGTQEKDVDMQDGTRPPVKTPNTYHFTSTVQDMVDSDVVQTKILDTLITLPLKDILGISADLQKQFAGLTKTRCEYTTKTVMAEPMDDARVVESAYIEELYGDEEFYEEIEDAAPTYSTVHLSYTENKDLDEVLLRYSSAVKVVSSPLFAMTTGRFSGNLAGQEVTFMVDRKVRPIPSYMPDPAGQVFKHIEIPLLPSLPFDVSPRSKFIPTERLMQE